MDEVTKWADEQREHWQNVARKLTVADLHEGLLEVERTARDVVGVPRLHTDETHHMAALRRALDKLDRTRVVIDEQQKAEGRWAS